MFTFGQKNSSNNFLNYLNYFGGELYKCFHSFTYLFCLINPSINQSTSIHPSINPHQSIYQSINQSLIHSRSLTDCLIHSWHGLFIRSSPIAFFLNNDIMLGFFQTFFLFLNDKIVLRFLQTVIRYLFHLPPWSSLPTRNQIIGP